MSQQPQTITADMIDRLPEPARRYMRWTGVIGRPWIDTARIRYSGRFRPGVDRPWLPIRATQIYTTRPPAFRWRARLSMWGLPLMSGHDRYAKGHGHMYGRIAGLFTIFDARGDEIDQGTMLRYLNETTWFPIALLGDNIAWQSVDHDSADVTFLTLSSVEYNIPIGAI